MAINTPFHIAYLQLRSGFLWALSSALVSVLAFGCTPPAHIYTRMTYSDVVRDTSALRLSLPNNCAASEHYIPDTLHPNYNPIRRMRVNFHFLRGQNGEGGFSDREAKEYAYYLTDISNDRMAHNRQMHLPLRNHTPVLPLNLQLVRFPNAEEYVHIHNDSTLMYYIEEGRRYNMTDDRMNRVYNVGGDSVMNAYLPVYPPKSKQAALLRVHGIAFPGSNWLKLIGGYEVSRDSALDEATGKKYSRGAWELSDTYVHELFHNLDLQHSWSGDGCADTPDNPNCWNTGVSRVCDTLWSNNYMDYNAHPKALTPCQIGILHAGLSRKGSPQRKTLIRDWCTLDSTKNIVIRDAVDWSGERDVFGNIVVEAGGLLTLHCRTAMPEGSRITVRIGGTLTLDGATLENDCGKRWQGIFIETQGNGRRRRAGRVVFVRTPIIRNISDVVEAP